MFVRGQKQGFSGWKVHLAEGGISGLRDITKGWFQKGKKEKGNKWRRVFSLLSFDGRQTRGVVPKHFHKKPIPMIIFSPKSTVGVKQYSLAVFRNTLNTQDYHSLKGVCILTAMPACGSSASSLSNTLDTVQEEFARESFSKPQSFAWQLPVRASWNQKYSNEIREPPCANVILSKLCRRCLEFCSGFDALRTYTCDSFFYVKFHQEESLTFDVHKYLPLA